MNMIRRLSTLFFLLSFLDPPRLTANPVGEVVRAGNATFNRAGPGALTINQTSDRVIIDWNSFSIGAGQITRFNQPSISSAALNRVLSGNPSQIFGTLQA